MSRDDDAEAVRLYHGTSAELCPQIERSGLIPCGGLVYLARFRASALEFAAISAAGAEHAGLDPRGLLVTVEVDERAIDRLGIFEAIVREPIPPDAIVALELVEPIARERLAARRRADFAVLARHRSRSLRDELADARQSHPLFGAPSSRKPLSER